MNLKLLQGLNKEEEQLFREEFIRSLRFRKRMLEVLRKEKETKEKSMRDEADFASPSWPLIQAEKIGQIRVYEQFIDFLDEK